MLVLQLRSDFDDLPAEEKLRSPLVVLGFFFLALPFVAGVYYLVLPSDMGQDLSSWKPIGSGFAIHIGSQIIPFHGTQVDL